MSELLSVSKIDGRNVSVPKELSAKLILDMVVLAHLIDPINGHSKQSITSEAVAPVRAPLISDVINRNRNDPRWRPKDGPYAHEGLPRNKSGEFDVPGQRAREVPAEGEWNSYQMNTDFIHGGDGGFRYRTSTSTTTTFTTTTPGMRNASNNSGLARQSEFDTTGLDPATADEINPRKKARAWNKSSDRQRKNKIMTIKDPQFAGTDQGGNEVDGFHHGHRDESDQYSVWGVSNSWQRGWCFDRKTYRMAEDSQFGSHTNLNCMTYCLMNYEQEDPEVSLQPYINQNDTMITEEDQTSAYGALHAWSTGKPNKSFRCMRDLPWWEYCDSSTNGMWSTFHSSASQWPDDDWYNARTDGRLCPLGQASNPLTDLPAFTTNYEESFRQDDMLNPIMLHDELDPVPGLGAYVEDHSIGTTNYPELDTYKMRCGHSVVPGYLMDLTSTDSFVQPDTLESDHPVGYWPLCDEEHPWVCDGQWTWEGPFGEKTQEALEELEALGSAEWPDRVFGHPNIKFNYFDEALLRKSKAWHDSDFPSWRIGLVSEDMVKDSQTSYTIKYDLLDDYGLSQSGTGSILPHNSPYTEARMDVLNKMNWVEERWQAANACQHKCELTPGCNSWVHFETMHQNWQIGYHHKTGEGISCLLKFDVQNRNLLENHSLIPHQYYRNDDYHTKLKRNRCATKGGNPEAGMEAMGCDGSILTDVPFSADVTAGERWVDNPFCPLKWWMNRPSANDPNGKWGDNPLSLFSNRFEGDGPNLTGSWDTDNVESGKCVFKDNTIQAGPKSCIIHNGSVDNDFRDPFELPQRATTYSYMESIPRAVADYQHVSGIDQVVEWDHTRGKDAWRGFNKIMQFHRAEVSINTSIWRMKGWYDYLGDGGEPMNVNHQHSGSWAAAFDPATGLPPVANYNSVMRGNTSRSISRRLSEGSMSREELSKELFINTGTPSEDELDRLMYDRERIQREYNETKEKLKRRLAEEPKEETVRLQPHQVARANVVRYLYHKMKNPSGRPFKELHPRRKLSMKHERRRRRHESIQREHASQNVFTAAKLQHNPHIGDMLVSEF
eukprot:GHVH01005005.1.p1 GENE.GHVH01005005.1~~GHVH01005005.1.p1  ORF type:complete len:1061 (+),score=188.34 GHVH01005005.1:1843-5025(+)